MQVLGSVHVYHERAGSIAEAIRAVDDTRTIVPLDTTEALHGSMREIEVFFAASPPREGWGPAVALRLIQMMGAGVDELLPAIDLPARVEIACARSIFAPEAAEHAIAMMLALQRGLPSFAARQHAHDWRPFPARTLAGQTLGLIGVGAIGSRIARIASAIGMKVLGISRRARVVDCVDEIVATDRLRDVLPRCDHVVVTVPRTTATHPLIDRASIAAMKSGVLVVHLSRGGVIDEDALFDALERGHVGGLAIDVFDEEPLPPTSRWWSAPNTIVTPHVAGLGVRYLERVVSLLLDNVRRLETGEPLIARVDREAGY